MEEFSPPNTIVPQLLCASEPRAIGADMFPDFQGSKQLQEKMKVWISRSAPLIPGSFQQGLQIVTNVSGQFLRVHLSQAGHRRKGSHDSDPRHWRHHAGEQIIADPSAYSG